MHSSDTGVAEPDPDASSVAEALVRFGAVRIVKAIVPVASQMW
jgi:hypothetical protein